MLLECSIPNVLKYNTYSTDRLKCLLLCPLPAYVNPSPLPLLIPLPLAFAHAFALLRSLHLGLGLGRE